LGEGKDGRGFAASLSGQRFVRSERQTETETDNGADVHMHIHLHTCTYANVGADANAGTDVAGGRVAELVPVLRWHWSVNVIRVRFAPIRRPADPTDPVLARTARPSIIAGLEAVVAPPPPLPIAAYDPALEIDRGMHIKLAGRIHKLSSNPASVVSPTPTVHMNSASSCSQCTKSENEVLFACQLCMTEHSMP
jgi:hypothetical protein